jgi:general secretion pathway protein A
MYLDYWRLQENPFDNTPDSRFLYPCRNHRDVLQKTLYAITSEKGCAMVSGEYGCGKTILVRTLVNRLDASDFEVALINYPVFDRAGFVHEVLQQFGQHCSNTGRADSFRELSRFFYQNIRRGRRNVLIIDEAQIADDPEFFEELRLILNMQLEDRFLVKVLLVGQPELREKMMLHPQLDQLIAVRCHLHRFDDQDTASYVRHRLKVAGSGIEIFTQEALYLMHRLSNGVPRRINNIADRCLWEGRRRQWDIVDGEAFRYVV